MIKIKGLYTGYSKDKPLLKDFNALFENKVYGILGSSGCGKTTLLRTIAGLTKPLAGEVWIDDKKITKPTENVFMLHQNYTSFDWLTCVENVLIPKKIRGKLTDEDVQKAFHMLNMVGLVNYADRYPKELSGGMRQRLALARTLFTSPQIILMDEPLSALDPNTRENMQDLILSMHKQNNSTILMVTHSPEEAKKMCDEIIRI